MPKTHTVQAFSAGGVTYRRLLPAPSAAGPSSSPDSQHDGTGLRSEQTPCEIVLVGRASDNFWVLPKGTPLSGESKEDAALREVEEETGITARIVSELGAIHYWFSRHGIRYSKEVLYYLMEATGGDVALHDHEYDDARWFPSDEVAARLAYANEAEIVREALSIIRQHLHSQERA